MWCSSVIATIAVSKVKPASRHAGVRSVNSEFTIHYCLFTSFKSYLPFSNRKIAKLNNTSASAVYLNGNHTFRGNFGILLRVFAGFNAVNVKLMIIAFNPYDITVPAIGL